MARRAIDRVAETRARVSRVLEALRAEPEGQEYIRAYARLRAENTFVPVYEVRGAEGKYTLTASSRPDLVEAYRVAIRSADRKATELGAEPGDWFDLAMELQGAAKTQALPPQEDTVRGLDGGSGHYHSSEPPKAQESPAPLKKTGIVWDSERRQWRRLA